MFGKKKRQIVGCDIGSSAIKMVELKAIKDGEYQLVHAALAELSPEAIVDGAIMDSSLVVEALSRLIADNGIKNQSFGGSLSGHSVIIKKIQLPSMSQAELGGVDPVGGRAVHPLRHQRRQPRLRGPGPG